MPLVADPVSIRQRARTPWWLRANLLALDAPAVAVLWLILFAVTLHIHLTFPPIATLGLACWVVYAADYWSDALRAAPTELDARHEFFRRHHTAIPVAIAGATVIGLRIAFFMLPADTIWHGALLGLGVLLYLGVTHAAPSGWRSQWPRELATAGLFASGVSLPVWNIGAKCFPAALVFASLCWINMSCIETWEWRLGNTNSHKPSLSAIWVSNRVSRCTLFLACGIFCMTVLSAIPAAFAIAAVLSCGGFALLDKTSERMSPNALRVAADAVLCTPALALILEFTISSIQ